MVRMKQLLENRGKNLDKEYKNKMKSFHLFIILFLKAKCKDQGPLKHSINKTIYKILN